MVELLIHKMWYIIVQTTAGVRAATVTACGHLLWLLLLQRRATSGGSPAASASTPWGSLHTDLRGLSLHTEPDWSQPPHGPARPQPQPRGSCSPRDFSLFKHWQPTQRRPGLGHE